MPKKELFFLDKFVKIASALRLCYQTQLVSGVWGSAPDSCLFLAELLSSSKSLL